MLELNTENALPYLSGRGIVATSVTSLGGGVSNTVLLVEGPSMRFVVKQSLGKLRVEEDWFSDRDRILRECQALRELAPYLPAASIPEVLFEDRDNFLFAMEAAPPGARAWKDLLLTGEVREETAERVGAMLAALIAAGLERPEWAASFGGGNVFDQLRLDPYYRFTAGRHPELASYFSQLIGETTARRVSLVHGDWSPKNFLIWEDRVMAIDFEVLHLGDPSFDAAFLLNHLLLKTFHRPAWRDAYLASARAFWKPLSPVVLCLPWFSAATNRHLGCLLLARIDGKSPAEYIRDDECKDRVRAYSRSLILKPPSTIEELFERWPH